MQQAEVPEGVVNLAHALVETHHLRAWFYALERLPVSFRQTLFSEMAAQMQAAGEDPKLADAAASRIDVPAKRRKDYEITSWCQRILRRQPSKKTMQSTDGPRNSWKMGAGRLKIVAEIGIASGG